VLSRERSPVCREGINDGALLGRDVSPSAGTSCITSPKYSKKSTFCKKRPALRDAVSEPETEGTREAVDVPDPRRAIRAGRAGRPPKRRPQDSATRSASSSSARTSPPPLPRRGGRALHLPKARDIIISPRSVYRYKDLEEPPHPLRARRPQGERPRPLRALPALGRWNEGRRDGKRPSRERSAREATRTARGRSSASRESCGAQKWLANRRLPPRGPGKAP
jgi:hypothetical protein